MPQGALKRWHLYNWYQSHFGWLKIHPGAFQRVSVNFSLFATYNILPDCSIFRLQVRSRNETQLFISHIRIIVGFHSSTQLPTQILVASRIRSKVYAIAQLDYYLILISAHLPLIIDHSKDQFNKSLPGIKFLPGMIFTIQ